MTAARYAVIRSSDQLVVNVVMWDGNLEKWQPPEGCYTRISSDAAVGDTWNGIDYAPAPPAPPDPDAAPIAAAIAQLRNTFGTARTAAQMNNSIDALTILLRRLYQELR